MVCCDWCGEFFDPEHMTRRTVGDEVYDYCENCDEEMYGQTN